MTNCLRGIYRCTWKLFQFKFYNKADDLTTKQEKKFEKKENIHVKSDTKKLFLYKKVIDKLLQTEFIVCLYASKVGRCTLVKFSK